jgi:hypothetical protein
MPFIQLQFRRGTASQWTSANTLLADGELAIETDTSKFKIGNGITSWNTLPYGGLVGPIGTIGNSVAFDISFNANIFVGGDVSFGGKLKVSNDVSFNSNLRVGGNLNIVKTTPSTSVSTGALIIGGGMGVAGNIWSGGNLFAARDVSFNNRLFVGGDVSFSRGNLNILKTTESTSSGTGAFIVGGGIGVGGNIWSGGNLFASGDASFNSQLFVGGDVSLGSSLYANGDVSFNSNLRVGADASFNGNVYFTKLPIYNGVAAPASNQLVTRSYVDINGGNVLLGSNNTWTANNFFNADVSFNSKLYVVGDASMNSNLQVGGNVRVSKNLFVLGDVSLNDNMSVQSDSSFNNRLYVGKQIGIGVTANASYSLDVLGNINMSGNLYLNNKLFSITSADISLNANLSVGSDSSFNGNVFIAKTLNYKKTVLAGGTSGAGATSIVAITPIVELAGSGVSTSYFTLANGSYAGQTLTIINSDPDLYVDHSASNIMFNGSYCSQMRFSSTFQTVNLIWRVESSKWIVCSWQGVNFKDVNMNFSTYNTGDITFGSGGKIFINPSVGGGGGLIVGSDSSFNGNLSVGGSDSSFNSNLYVGVGKRIGVGKIASNLYALDVGGNVNFTGNLYTNGVLFSAFDNSKDISLNANLTVGFDSSFNANLFVGRRFTVGAGDVSLNQRLFVGGDVSFGGNLRVNGDVSFNGETRVGGNLNIVKTTASTSVTTGAFIVGGGMGVGGNIWSGGNLFAAGDASFNNRLFVGGDVSFGGNLRVNGDVSFNSNLRVGGNLNIVKTTASTSSGTGALIVNGGVGVGGNIWSDGNLFAAGDVSLNQRLTVGGADSSFNGNLFVGGYTNVNGYINADSYIEKFVNVVTSSGTYTANFNNGLIIYVKEFTGSSTPTLSITNLPVDLNQSYVFSVIYRGAATGTYFSSLNINGISVPVNGTVSLTSMTSYYIHQFCIFFTDATSIGNNFVVQTFNSSAPVGLVSPSIYGDASFNAGNVNIGGNINLSGNIYQNGSLFSGAGGTGGSSSGNLYVSGDISFGGKLYGNGDVSLNRNVNIGLDSSLNGNVNITKVLRMSPIGVQNKRIVLYEGTDDGNLSSTNFYGFGINYNTLRYQTDNISATHRFYSGVNNGTLWGGKIILSGNATVGNGSIPDQTAGNETLANFPLLITSTKTTSSTLYSMGMGVDFVSGAGFISCAGNNTFTPLLLNPRGNGGNVGIGISTNPTSTLQVGGNVKVDSVAASTNISTGALVVGGGIGVGGNVQVGGNVFINSGTATGGYTSGALVVNGGVGINNGIRLNGQLFIESNLPSTSTTTGAIRLGNGVASGIGLTGNIYAGGTINATSFNATSDYRIKHNVHSISDDASFNVDVLRPVSFVNTKLGKPDIGFIAHEVSEHYPYLVNGEKDGENMQSLNYTGIIGILVKEIQELKKETRELKGRVADLENPADTRLP